MNASRLLCWVIVFLLLVGPAGLATPLTYDLLLVLDLVEDHVDTHRLYVIGRVFLALLPLALAVWVAKRAFARVTARLVLHVLR